ncbi:MAG: hypothetical protein FJ398_04425 [Verrucomicrobia bacterium]|nr:hypothetical protein [Verrucomicrobiota bacterium]
MGARIVFIWIAFHVAIASWIYARRKVAKVSGPVLMFFAVLFVGAGCLIWEVTPPKGFVLFAALVGLLDGFVLVKTVKIRAAEPAEKLPPLRLGEFLQWDAKALKWTSSAVVTGWLMLVWLIWRLNYDWVPAFAIFSVQSALFPPVIVALRATTGKRQEFFWVLLFFPALSSICPFLAYLIGAGFDMAANMLAGTLAGIAAGCLLIHFGKIHPKAR